MLRTRANIIPAKFLVIATFVAASIVGAALMNIGRVSSAEDESPSAVQIQRRVQVVRFTLYDVGIHPQEARANPGHVTISIEDLTRSSSGIVVERVEVTGHIPAGLLNKATDRLRLRGELLLPPGRYELADASRRDNRAVLIVEP